MDTLTLMNAPAKPSPREAMVLYDYVQLRLTVRQIAATRRLTVNAVKCALRKLRRKGLLTIAGHEGVQKGGRGVSIGVHSHPKTGNIRVEAQQFKVRILNGSQAYQRLLAQGNFIPDWEGNELRLYADEIEIYSRQHFYGRTVQDAYAASAEYWSMFGRLLEHRLQVLLIKPGVPNWKFVKACEVATEGSDVARMAEIDGTKMRFFAKDDGKLFFTCDWSTPRAGRMEHETHHPERSKLDAERIEKQLWDWSKNDPRTNSEIEQLFAQLADFQLRQAELNKDTAAGLATAVRAIFPQRNDTPFEKAGEDGLHELRRYTG